MDQHNNGIVAREWPAFDTWEDVVRWARAKIVESAARNGDGEGGRALWLDKQPADWRPSFENVPITPVEKGGPEHSFGVQIADAPRRDLPERGAAFANPLGRPPETWSEQDVSMVMNSPAYLIPGDADRGQAHRMVRSWFERRFGTGPARVDATGRPVREDLAMARYGGSCPVPIRAHTRKAARSRRQRTAAPRPRFERGGASVSEQGT